FISAIDSIGAVPPINESHVEMDAAWALYEAYIKLLTGEVDTALVYGFGKSSAGTLRRVLALQPDPYSVAPLGPDSVSRVVRLAAGERGRELNENPAWITGFEHRIETPVIGARDLTTSPSTAASANAATGGDSASIEAAEIYAPFTHQQLILTEAIGLPSS